MQGGSRSNAGKPRWTLLPLDALAAVVEVLEMGARKYAPRNWEKGLSWSETADSLLRHLVTWHRGERFDPESRQPHLAHVACNALFLLAHELRGIGTDDRPRGDSVFGTGSRTVVLGRLEPSPLGSVEAPPRADEPSDDALDAMSGTPPSRLESSPPGYLAPPAVDLYGGD